MPPCNSFTLFTNCVVRTFGMERRARARAGPRPSLRALTILDLHVYIRLKIKQGKLQGKPVCGAAVCDDSRPAAALGLVRGPKPQAVRRCQNPTYAYESPRGLKGEVPWMRMPSAVVAGCSGSSTTPQPASHVYTVDERETDSSGRLGIHQGIPMS